MIRIESRDWQDMLNKLERLAAATESIAQSLNDGPAIAAALAKVKEDSAKLNSALPNVAQP